MAVRTDGKRARAEESQSLATEREDAEMRPYKGRGKRKLKKMPFTTKGYILYYAFFWIIIISIYLAH